MGKGHVTFDAGVISYLALCDGVADVQRKVRFFVRIDTALDHWGPHGRWHFSLVGFRGGVGFAALEHAMMIRLRGGASASKGSSVWWCMRGSSGAIRGPSAGGDRGGTTGPSPQSG